jgi:hypothetical protein
MLEEKQFFFEAFCAARFRLRGFAAQSSGRENQKTFDTLGRAVAAATPMPWIKGSLFASFSSEKEGLL